MSKLNWRAVWKEVESKADSRVYPNVGEVWIFRLYASEKQAIKRAVEKQLTPELIEALNDDAEEMK